MSLQENKSLEPYNSFGVAAQCRYFFEFHSAPALIEFIQQHPELMQQHVVIGGGSNLLITQNYEGLVLHPAVRGIQVEREDQHGVYVRVGAGEVWDDFVAWAVSEDLSGVENLSLIPGLVGACAVQNIGAYGVEAQDVIVEVAAIHLETGVETTFSEEACQHGYRDSIFKNELKNQYAITSVVFRLQREHHFKLDYGTLQQELASCEAVNLPNIRQVVIAIRTRKLPDPQTLKNAGSFFKNPILSLLDFEELNQRFPELPHYSASATSVKVPAGWLIEQCGWKGKRFGSVGVHEHQALVLVNYGGASGKEIYQLALEIVDSVLHTFGITLEMEVVLI